MTEISNKTVIEKKGIYKPNPMNEIVLIRGLPGSGKTTVANMMYKPRYVPGVHSAATDDWFTDDEGNYDFKPADLVVNHAACLNWFETRVKKAIAANIIIVHNTFTMLWELHPYISYVKNLDTYKDRFRINVIDIFDGGLSDDELAKRNAHGVGVEAIKRMRDRWVPWSWKDYNHYVGGIETFGKRWG
jgi:hypothetical protein